METLTPTKFLQRRAEIWEIAGMARVVYVGDEYATGLHMELRVLENRYILGEIRAIETSGRLSVVIEEGDGNATMYLRAPGEPINLCKVIFASS